ncbi:phenylacetate--CoA ligase family protein [Pinibacter aurantiacus]|uniref:AMP-binding protein n=1 Tax=Pinibacter aurantiacus TaxID=2851599 RepID=A0A9E2S837_9BACT|nr:AMP-binding protein [Pinibacter aurantiacus]MBV4358011.1 AMP-binding protein [Pinibacter aurantiacus]
MYSTETAFASTESIDKMQLGKLQEILAYVNQHSAFYKELFAKHHINVQRIDALEKLQLLPVTEKEDVQQRNWAFLCVDKSKIVEYTATSGTLGKPVTIALTENDLERLAYNEYASFLCADGSESDVYQLMLTLDRQFMAGMAYYSGIRKMNAGMIRVGPGVPAMQWDIIQRLQPTALVAVPSFIVRLIEFANENGIDVNKSSVKKAICIGENLRNGDFSLNTLGRKITDNWNIQLYSTYASTEMQTAFTECKAGKGGHHNPELVIIELLDENNQPVADGEPGEVTITTLGVEAMPLIRYKTGDICRYEKAPCSCGRNTLRLSPVIGRKKQMIKFKGTTLYPPVLFDILASIDEIKDYVTEVSTNAIGMDELLVHILPANYSEENDRKIRSLLQAKLRVIPSIKYASAQEIQRMQFVEGGRKMVRFIDRR